MRLAESALQGKLIQALSITDNAGGHPALFPTPWEGNLPPGLEPIIPFYLQDKNATKSNPSFMPRPDRNPEPMIMTGDFPLYGFEGKAKPVYDLDSVQLLRLVGQMNAGAAWTKGPRGRKGMPAHPVFQRGGGLPFKKLEAEVCAQYFKLHKN